MDVHARADRRRWPEPPETEPVRQYVQWLTCTSCQVAWLGFSTTAVCWCCERGEDVRLRWAA